MGLILSIVFISVVVLFPYNCYAQNRTMDAPLGPMLFPILRIGAGTLLGSAGTPMINYLTTGFGNIPSVLFDPIIRTGNALPLGVGGIPMINFTLGGFAPMF